MKGTTFKRCSCRNPQTGKALGRACPELRRPDGGYSSRHGNWHYQIDLPATGEGGRRVRRRGGFDSQTDADAELGRVRAVLAVADPTDSGQQVLVGDLVDEAFRTGSTLPTVEQARKALYLGSQPSQLPTMAEYLDAWLAGRRNIKTGTVRSYESHIRLYLKPHVGDVRVDRLRPEHIETLLDAIDDRNTHILDCRGSTEPKVRASVKGMRTVGPATVHRVHATLRKALNDAVRRKRYLDINPATLVELPPAKPPKARVWTDERVARWRATGEVPSAVMVWTPEQTGAFLDHVAELDDRLYALYHVVALRGLRRGEVCGLHWDDLDLDALTLTVRWQIVQHGWATALDTPKTDGSDATIALDEDTGKALRAHRARQNVERLAAGTRWVQSGLVFSDPNGEPLHPADVTRNFRRLTTSAGLPPIRLHDLRHGAATIALAAGADMKTVQALMRHSSYNLTANLYAHVLPDLARQAAEASAAIIPRRRRAVAA